MFHRQRPALNLHATPSEGGEHAPESAASVTLTDSSTPDVQPPAQAQKEAEPMSNYTPTNTPTDSQTDSSYTTSTQQQPTPQQMGTASFTQRAPMMQPVVRSPYGYAPAYGSSQDTNVSTGRKLVLGEGITMSGEIEACDHLVVEGTVEATLKGASVLEVAQTGMFYGAVEINEATIAGRFEGDLVVNGRLTVRSTGTVTGTLSYKELSVEAGATIDGKMTPMREGRTVTSSTSQKSSSSKAGIKPVSASTASNELPLQQSQTAAA